MNIIEILGAGSTAAVVHAIGSAAKTAWVERRTDRETAAKAALDARAVEVRAAQERDSQQNNHEANLLGTLVSLARGTAEQAVTQGERIANVVVQVSTALNGLQAAVATLSLDVRALTSKVDALEDRFDVVSRASGVVVKEKAV